ncbi:hypothetical protein [uncultured Pedobacter sp.]|uniref:hypothetical protein n=1 Tax=uncultured Pedobacter sp. TaxID=246139 RepID=UPI002605BB85|nr:hypothetical protein [uncultured Pedobacter sp.]
MKRAYDYFFYSLYRFSQAAPSKWWSEYKVWLSITVLEGFLCFSVIFYTSAYLKKNILPESQFAVILFTILLLAFNYYLFLYKNKWEKVIASFDHLSKKAKIVYDFLCWLAALFIIVGLIFSIYALSQVDWESIRSTER